MKDLFSYVPKKYRHYIADFYREYDNGYSYWLTLRQDGKYHLEGYEAEYTIHENTIQDVLRVLREHIAEKE